MDTFTPSELHLYSHAQDHREKGIPSYWKVIPYLIEYILGGLFNTVDELKDVIALLKQADF